MHKLKILFKIFRNNIQTSFHYWYVSVGMEQRQYCPYFQKKKKNGKENLKNYSPVSLLPICGKIFERVIFIFVGLAPKGLMKCSVL